MTPEPGNQFLLWLAQGLGSGRMPKAPGTWGSLVGLLWLWLLLCPGSWIFWLAGMTAGFGASVWLCGVAERMLGMRDPSSVVLDEIVAIPLCFAYWLYRQSQALGHWPDWRICLEPANWLWLGVIFGAFRLFDILKPWPVGWSQALPGGWGITMDDLLAALYVNLVVYAVCCCR